MADDGNPPNLPPPGWYPDPEGSGGLRWWDGQQWTSHVQGGSGWRSWLTMSSTALTIDRWIARLAGLALLVAATLLVLVVARRQPIGGVGLLLVPGVPVVIVGQLWAIGILNARTPRPPGGWRARMASQMRAQRSPVKFFFGGLPKQAGYALVGTFFLGWLAAVTAFPFLTQGSPTHSPTCPWALENHGVISCVSHAKYEQAGAAGERLAAGVLMGFLAVHFGVAASETPAGEAAVSTRPRRSSRANRQARGSRSVTKRGCTHERRGRPEAPRSNARRSSDGPVTAPAPS